MKNSDKKCIIRKIPLSTLIQMLDDIYRKGADFVDIHGEATTSDQDEITVVVPQEYINKEYMNEEPSPPSEIEEEDEIVEEEVENDTPLTEEDVKNLLNG